MVQESIGQNYPPVQKLTSVSPPGARPRLNITEKAIVTVT